MTSPVSDSASPWVDALLSHAHLTMDDISGIIKSFTITGVRTTYLTSQFSELGDKTFLVSAILAMRHSPVVVFWGCWSAMICMSVLSSLMGAILPALLSPRTAHWITALLFLGFGVYTLYQGLHMTGNEINEEWKEAQEEIQADEEDHEMDVLERGEEPQSNPNVKHYPRESLEESRADRTDRTPALLPPKAASMGAYLREGTRNLMSFLFNPVFSQAFLLSFLGEWGDRSQITTMALAATHRVFIVAIATSLAHLACIAIAVSAGALLASRLSVRHLTIGGAIFFLLFGCVAAYEAMFLLPWN
ncbi:vacuole protein [Malassezia pachydermatis]|uniref:GDT1 family protein n=1 Tax=Malassezia pachydermatis TaxID=77020 RepID=A0A0M8MM90_9BASI|nr:vacuole protein [Malassezia pachydermatis]KOS14398.1 vacuole protein [Malassezia pachydermatis]